MDKIENWTLLVNTKEEKTWQYKLNDNILVQVQDEGDAFVITKYDVAVKILAEMPTIIGRERKKEDAINVARQYMNDMMEEEYKKIFIDKIKEYNACNERWEHYIKIDDKKIMIIEWTHKWSWRIAILEFYI